MEANDIARCVHAIANEILIVFPTSSRHCSPARSTPHHPESMSKLSEEWAAGSLSTGPLQSALL
jgi:hypothetical protein